jgi:hypothetical protein
MKNSETGLLGGTPKNLLSLEILLKILFLRPYSTSLIDLPDIEIDDDLTTTHVNSSEHAERL